MPQPQLASNRAAPIAPAKRFQNSKQTNIIIGLAFLIFLSACIAVAFLGTGGETAEGTRVQTAAPVPNNDANSAAPAVIDEADADPREADADSPDDDNPDDAIPVVAEEAETAEAARVTDEPISAPAPVAAGEPETTDPETTELETTDPETTDPETTEAVPAETDTSESEPDLVEAPQYDSPDSPPGAPETHSILSGNRIFLRGVVQSAEIERQVVTAVEAVLGKGNVVSEYVIDPDSPDDSGEGSPVYFDDAVWFESGSSTITEESYALLQYAPILLQLQPTVVITISGHTDSTGSAANNLELSQTRVDTVREWIIDQGGDADRLIAIGLGETEPRADNETEAGRALNRRVSFLIEGFKFAD